MSDAKALATTKGQIHEDNIELSVYSCWTAKLLLRAKLVSSHIDPKGKFITFDIDDDETAKPQFLESQPQSRLLIEEAVAEDSGSGALQKPRSQRIWLTLRSFSGSEIQMGKLSEWAYLKDGILQLEWSLHNSKP